MNQLAQLLHTNLVQEPIALPISNREMVTTAELLCQPLSLPITKDVLIDRATDHAIECGIIKYCTLSPPNPNLGGKPTLRIRIVSYSYDRSIRQSKAKQSKAKHKVILLVPTSDPGSLPSPSRPRPACGCCCRDECLSECLLLFSSLLFSSPLFSFLFFALSELVRTGQVL